MKRISHEQLHELAAQAARLARGRKNLNLHDRAEDPIQRMFLVFQPGTYVRPHCHQATWELLVVLSGQIRIPCFDGEGRVTEVLELGPESALQAAELPAGTVHTVLALAPDSTLLEVKHGPYTPTTEKDFAAWAPAENGPQAVAFERWARTCAPGTRWQG